MITEPENSALYADQMASQAAEMVSIGCEKKYFMDSRTSSSAKAMSSPLITSARRKDNR